MNMKKRWKAGILLLLVLMTIVWWNRKLLEINPDTIAWIRFPDEPSQINYPVVQGTDNSKYLKKTFSSNENTLGAIFLNVEGFYG